MKDYLRLAVVLIALICSLNGCSGGGDDVPGDPDSVESLAARFLTGETDADGGITFEFSISEAVAAFQLAAAVDEGFITLQSLTAPSGSDVLASGIEKSDATTQQEFISTFNFPTLSDAIEAGTYTAKYLVNSSRSRPAPGKSVNLTISNKGRGATAGVLRVNISVVGPAVDSPDTLDAIDDAIEIWRLVFSRKDIALDVEMFFFAGTDGIPDPRDGDALYTTISSSTRREAVNIVIGTDVIGVGGNQERRFGLIGQTPAPLIPSPKSAAAISILDITGGDGKFNDDDQGFTQFVDDEVRLLSEEMARLAGNYLGLVPIVDFRGSRVESIDSIDDTPSCITLTDCENEAEPRENFMFPRIIRDRDDNNDDKVYSRDRITDGQRDLMFRSPLMQ